MNSMQPCFIHHQNDPYKFRVNGGCEERALTTFHSLPRFWRRCVDDTFIALPRDLVQQLLSHLISTEPCIQFTVEADAEGKLPFSDVCLQRVDDGSLTTSVFRKATHPTNTCLLTRTILWHTRQW